MRYSQLAGIATAMVTVCPPDTVNFTVEGTWSSEHGSLRTNRCPPVATGL